jgi:TusA-related sulfurtransferase
LNSLPSSTSDNSTTDRAGAPSIDRQAYFIDITGDVCPLTFVKTKLLLEKMPPGAVATVRLKGVQPLDNVPRSVRAHGHEVISLEPEEGSPEAGSPEGSGADPRRAHILTIRRV